MVHNQRVQFLGELLGRLLELLNWVDWIVLLLVLGHAVGGLARGLIFGALDLVGLALSLWIATVGQHPAAAVMQQFADVSQPIATLVGYVGLLTLTQLGFSAATHLLLRISLPIRLVLLPLSCLDKLLGLLPGTIKGLLWAGMIILPLATLSLSEPISDAIEDSVFARPVLSVVAQGTRGREWLLGAGQTETLSPLLAPNGSSEPLRNTLP